MAQKEDNKQITLDDLLRIVDTAAQTIERLQSINTSLARQMRECELATHAANENIGNKARQIEELERSEAMLREDAQWCRWFKKKYGSSTFFSHIEREYQNEHGAPAMLGNLAEANPASDSSPHSRVARDVS